MKTNLKNLRFPTKNHIMKFKCRARMLLSMITLIKQVKFNAYQWTFPENPRNKTNNLDSKEFILSIKIKRNASNLFRIKVK